MLRNPITARISFRCSSMTRFGVIATLLSFAVYEYGARGLAAGPDAVADVGGGGVVHGCVNGTQAFSTYGGVCNIGDAGLPGSWDPTLPISNHPMWTQNLYRLENNRFEQIGMSWVKHDNWTSNEGDCVDCGDTCDFSICAGGLCPGCKDTYTCENSEQYRMGPRSEINPTIGLWPTGGPGSQTYCNTATGGGVIACRLQVKVGDLGPNHPTAQYFLEQQVITPDETEATRNNNASYKPATVGACDAGLCTLSICGEDRSCTGTGTGCSCNGVSPSLYPLTLLNTEPPSPFCQKPAISAWKDSDPNNVVLTYIPDHLEGQDGGQFILAAKAKKLVETCTVNCWYSYEYALYNMNSDRSAGGFRVALPNGLSPPDVRFPTNLADRFHGIAYHSGDEALFDGTDWDADITTCEVRWTVASSSTNALRWGTLYNFRFEANRAPAYASTITIDLFKPCPTCPPGPPCLPCPSSVRGVSVGPAPASPFGACCVGGACTGSTQTCCSSQGGTFLGAGTTCATTAGACCVGTTCTVEAKTCCINQGGGWIGVGSTCDDGNENDIADVCEGPGACCDGEGACIIATPFSCPDTFFGTGTVCGTWECAFLGPQLLPPEP